MKIPTLKPLLLIAFCMSAALAGGQTYNRSFEVGGDSEQTIETFYEFSYDGCVYLTTNFYETSSVTIFMQKGRTYDIDFHNDFDGQPGREDISGFIPDIDGYYTFRVIASVGYLNCNFTMNWSMLDAATILFFVSNSIDSATVVERIPKIVGDLDEDGVSDEYFVSIEGYEVLGNGDRLTSIALPSGFAESNSSLYVNFQGRWITLKELADRIGYEVADIIGLAVQNGSIQATISDAVSDAIIGGIYGWAVSKINPPPETEISIGFTTGDDLVPVYKPQYDPERRAYLANLDWWGAKLGKGKIVLEGNPAAEQKVKVYRSPAKGATAEEWGSIVLGAEDSGAIRKFYIEGIDPSASLNDVVITLRYYSEKQSVAAVASEWLSTKTSSEDLTVYEVNFEEITPFTGFDDNSEGEYRIPALMVPLGPSGQQGSNSIRVTTRPNSLYSRFRVETTNSSIGGISIDIAGPLTSADMEFSVFGTQHGVGSRLEVEDSNSGLIIAKLWIDVKNKIANAASIDLFRIATPQEFDQLVYPESFSESELEDLFNAVTWGKQANVYVDVVQRRLKRINYDNENPLNGLDVNGRLDGETAEQFKIVSDTFDQIQGNLQIFVVNKFAYYDAGYTPAAFYRIRSQNNQSIIFVDESRTNINVYAHELGHALGLNAVSGEGHSAQSTSDVMYESTFNNNNNRKRIRRIDWNTVNP